MADNTANIAERARSLRSPKFGEIAQVRDLIAGKENVINLGYGEPGFDTPKHIREAGKKAIEKGYTHYVLPVEGLAPLREAIAKKLNVQNGIDADPDGEILVTAGVQEAINVALMTLINPGDEVIIPEPYYYSHPLGVALAGGVPVFTRLKEERQFRIDPQDIRDKVNDKTKAIAFITPNCPTGAVFQKEDLEEILKIAIEHHLYVITDEIYENIIYDGEKHWSIASLPKAREYVVAMFGFSKAFAMTGWRIGYMTAARELIKNMIEVHGQLTICTNSIAQKAALAALTGDQACVEEMRCGYEERRNLFVSGLRDLGFGCELPKGSFYVYANVSRWGRSGLDFAKQLAREANVLGYPGTAFTEHESGKNYVRFTYTRPIKELQEALDRTGRMVGNL
jgi:aminotransferase